MNEFDIYSICNSDPDQYIGETGVLKMYFYYYGLNKKQDFSIKPELLKFI